jgi:hypothetical protein
MSVDYMQQYRDLYSKYIEHSVALHNYHRTFITYTGYETGIILRRHIRAIRKIEHEMIEVSRKAYRQVREQKKANAEAKKALKKTKKEKKNVDNNGSN